MEYTNALPLSTDSGLGAVAGADDGSGGKSFRETVDGVAEGRVGTTVEIGAANASSFEDEVADEADPFAGIEETYAAFRMAGGVDDTQFYRRTDAYDFTVGKGVADVEGTGREVKSKGGKKCCIIVDPPCVAVMG